MGGSLRNSVSDAASLPLTVGADGAGGAFPAAASVNIPNVISAIRVAAVLVVLLGVFREVFVYGYGEETFFKELRQLDLDDEANVPTWFSSVLMFAISVTAFLIYRGFRCGGTILRLSWAGLSVVFLALSIEEVAGFHEALMVPLRLALGAGGVFHYAWVIPAFFLVSVFVVLSVPFLIRTPLRYRVLFVVAGAIYVAGAMGLEMIGGLVASSVGEDVYYYGFITVVEEAMEIAGLTIFAGAVLEYFATGGGRIDLIRS